MSFSVNFFFCFSLKRLHPNPFTNLGLMIFVLPIRQCKRMEGDANEKAPEIRGIL